MGRFFQLEKGYSRAVWLVGKYALKFPRVRCWRQFACGILSNLRESENWEDADRKQRRYLAPILWHSNSGLLVIMKRAQPIDYLTYLSPPQIEQLSQTLKHAVGHDLKKSSFGIICGKVVAVDYHRNIST